MDDVYRLYTCTCVDENCRIESFQEACKRNKHIRPETLGKEGFYVDKRYNIIRCYGCSFASPIANRPGMTNSVIEDHTVLTRNPECIAEINSKPLGWWRRKHFEEQQQNENYRIASFEEACKRNKYIQPVTLGKEGFYMDKKDNVIRCFRCSFSTVIADEQDITKRVIRHHILLTGNKLCIAEINSKPQGWWRKL